MARAPYQFSDQAAPAEVTPEVVGARQSIQTSPETFGAGTGRALEQLGATTEHVGNEALNLANFYGQVAMDDGANKLQDRLDKLKYGDPNSVGPDGNPDTGFLGKRGADAMHAYKPTVDQVDQAIKETRDNLPTPKSQIEFDRFSARMRADALARLGTHYEQEGKTWAVGVNKAAVATNLTDIAREPDNDDLFKHRLADLQAASDKNVHLAGGGDEERNAALTAIKASAWKTRIESIGVKEPDRAAKMADDHKGDLGLHYDEVANSLRSRAAHAEGAGVAQQAFDTSRANNFATNPRNPIFQQAAMNIPGGMAPAGIARTIMIESSGKANAGAGSAHEGYIQASDKYWSAFGGGGSKFNLTDSTFALARSSAHDRPILASALGRDPTDAELYLAHQQGPAGAKALLSNPSLPAAKALTLAGVSPDIAVKSIKGNGGDPNAPAAAFTSMWVNKFNRTSSVAPPIGLSNAVFYSGRNAAAVTPQQGPSSPPEAPPALFADIPHHQELVRADAYQSLLNREYSSPEARDAALSEFHKLYAASQIADAQTEKDQKQANSDVANELITAIHTGQADKALSVIGNNSDPRLTDPHMREWLWNIAMQDPDNSPARDLIRFGPKYADALNRMTKENGDPERLGSPGDLVRMLANHEITAAGYRELHGLFQTMQKDDRGPLYASVLNAQIQYARRQLRLDEGMDFPGMPKVVNRKGEDIFDKKFLPAYNDALRVAQENGKATEFLRDENTDKFLAPYLKEARQGALDAKIGALGTAREQATPAQLQAEQRFLVAPKDVPQEKWDTLIAQPPELPSGGKTSPARWGAAIQLLDKNRDQKHLDLWREALPNVDPMPILQQLDAERGKMAPVKNQTMGFNQSLGSALGGKGYASEKLEELPFGSMVSHGKTAETLEELPYGKEVEAIRGQR
jgi:hypothetical protein